MNHINHTTTLLHALTSRKNNFFLCYSVLFQFTTTGNVYYWFLVIGYCYYCYEVAAAAVVVGPSLEQTTRTVQSVVKRSVKHYYAN